MAVVVVSSARVVEDHAVVVVVAVNYDSHIVVGKVDVAANGWDNLSVIVALLLVTLLALLWRPLALV